MHLHFCRRTAVLSAILAAAMMAPASAQGVEQVLATINGEAVSSQQLTDQLLLRWGELTLESLIQEMVIEQAAAKAGIEVADKEVTKRGEDFQRSIDVRAPVTGQSFTLWLAEQKLTLYGFRQRLRGQMLLEKMVEDQVAVTDQEVAEAWERNKGKLRKPEQMHVSHICVKTQEEAAKIHAEILGGKDFAEAAAQHSIDPWSKDRAGDFGWIHKGSDPFQRAAFKLTQDGDMSSPVQSKMGWHLIRREEYQAASQPTFEAVQDELREGMLRQRRLQKMNEKRAEIVAAAKIERKLDPADLVSTTD